MWIEMTGPQKIREKCQNPVRFLGLASASAATSDRDREQNEGSQGKQVGAVRKATYFHEACCLVSVTWTLDEVDEL